MNNYVVSCYVVANPWQLYPKTLADKNFISPCPSVMYMKASRKIIQEINNKKKVKIPENSKLWHEIHLCAGI